ncbi:rod shape-determining protein MreC [Candidatus Daviesbacteria bacterium]|nr:rod shape-determining protein MreC [Candidatus Daviesbacteria bacterium]
MISKLFPNLAFFLLLTLISLTILGLDKINFLRLPKKTLSFLTVPIQYGLYSGAQTLGWQFKFVYQARFAAKENKALQNQIGQLLSENAHLRTKLAEAEAFLEQNQSIDPKTYHLVPARPIGLERFLKIDKGISDGVKVNQSVIFKDNYLGRVVAVSEKSSSVMLLKDPDSKVAAFSLNKNGKAKGVLVGQFGQEMLLDKILHEEKIEQDDLVYSEGTEGFLPRGLILGQVQQVLEKKTEVFKQAKISSVFDIRDLELVFIIME